MDLNKKTAVVTGAGSGLGRAISQALVAKGVKVFGLSRNWITLGELKKELGENFEPVKMDLRQKEKLQKWINETFSEDFCPEILINNAGVGFFKEIDQTSDEEWLNAVNTNLNGMFFLTKPIAALMKKKKQPAHIINIGSILGMTTRSEATAYCATKFGVRGFSEALFKELRSHNIKVTSVNPGSIATEFFKSSNIEAHENMLHPSDLAKTIVHVLETPENMLINELTIRPLNPKHP